jgi:hypothetical protein
MSPLAYFSGAEAVISLVKRAKAPEVQNAVAALPASRNRFARCFDI